MKIYVKNWIRRESEKPSSWSEHWTIKRATFANSFFNKNRSWQSNSSTIISTPALISDHRTIERDRPSRQLMLPTRVLIHRRLPAAAAVAFRASGFGRFENILARLPDRPFLSLLLLLLLRGIFKIAFGRALRGSRTPTVALSPTARINRPGDCGGC